VGCLYRREWLGSHVYLVTVSRRIQSTPGRL
jgi:hypothetical protein